MHLPGQHQRHVASAFELKGDLQMNAPNVQLGQVRVHLTRFHLNAHVGATSVTAEQDGAVSHAPIC